MAVLGTAAAEGSNAGGSQHRRLDLEGGPTPQRVAGHDEAGEDSQVDAGLDVAQRPKLLDPSPHKSQAIKPQRTAPLVSAEKRVLHAMVTPKQHDGLQPDQAEHSGAVRGVR